MRAGAALVALGLAVLPAHGQDVDYSDAFVSAFAEVCVPERLSYPGTKANAERLGWIVTQRSAHPELQAMMAKMDAGAAEAAEEMQATFDHMLYSKTIADTPHFLVVSRASYIVDFGAEADAEPDPWTYIGCYLYNFEATAPIDPAPMSALTGNEIAQEVDQEGLVSYVWGPPCRMPRTGDSYLSFIADDSPHAATTGFSGLMMKFETSEPDEGEVVPATYCTDDAPSAEN